MKTEITTIKKITPKIGYLLTNGEVITDVIFMNESESLQSWWEIPNENYIVEYDGSSFLCPIIWENNMEVKAGLWYTDKENILEAIKNGIPKNFSDSEYFNII